jgi:AGZA family xanthine/uracil permease-like MFS transporter
VWILFFLLLTYGRAYIIAVNSTILADSGGTCVCNDQDNPTCRGANDFQTQYDLCLLGMSRP